MPVRTIATIRTFVSRAEARTFVAAYNAEVKGCLSAALDDGEDDLPILVRMLEHDTDAEAAEARRES